MISVPLDHQIFAPCFMSLDMFQCLLVYSLWNMNKICILLLDEETMETVTVFISLGSKITSDGDCSHEIKKYLFLGRKAMINIDSILKSRDITLLTKVHLGKAMVYPVVMYVHIHTQTWRTGVLLSVEGLLMHFQCLELLIVGTQQILVVNKCS